MENIYWSKVLTERFSILYKTQNKDNITFKIIDHWFKSRYPLLLSQKYGIDDENHSTVTRFLKSSNIRFSGIFMMKSFSFCTKLSSLHVFNPKNHKINLIWRTVFLLKRFTKLHINFRVSKPKKSHLSEFPFSFCPNLYQSTFYNVSSLSASKRFGKAMKIAMKACNHERKNSSDLKPEIDASLNITCRKAIITYCISKSCQLNVLIDWF